jgi:hypothetical protein
MADPSSGVLVVCGAVGIAGGFVIRYGRERWHRRRPPTSDDDGAWRAGIERRLARLERRSSLGPPSSDGYEGDEGEAASR